MATIDSARKFAEQSAKVERVLQEAGVTGNAGRIVLVLTMANSCFGVSQKEVVEALGAPKDVISKLLTSLVKTHLIRQERQSTNSRTKRISITDSGRDLLHRTKAVLQKGRTPERTHKSAPEYMTFDFDDLPNSN